MDVVVADRTVALDPSTLSRLEEAIFRGEGRRLAVGLKVVGDAEIHAINRDFLAHDETTDVIAFDVGGPEDDVSEDGLDGQILVNAAMAAREAADRGHAPEAELLFYVAHGLLHLLGYDDATPEQRVRMLDLQADYLRQVGLEIRS